MAPIRLARPLLPGRVGRPDSVARSLGVQAKLDVGWTHDRQEQEADQLADRIVGSIAMRSSRGCPCGGGCPRCTGPVSTAASASGRAYGVQRSGDEPAASAGKEITLQDLANALSGAQFEDRVVNIAAAFAPGDYITPATLLALVGLPESAPADESPNRATARSLLGQLDRIERTADAFRVVLKVDKVRGSIDNPGPDLGFAIDNGAEVEVSSNGSGDVVLKVSGIRGGFGILLGVPNMRIDGDNLIILGKALNVVPKSKDSAAPEPVQRQHHSGQQASSQPAGRSAPAIVESVLESPGQSLPAAVRQSFEGPLGRDLGDIRIHTDARAAASADAIAARAYTAGHHIVFANARFAPDSDAGRHLLAHELVHVLQQDAQAHGAGRSGLVRRSTNPSLREVGAVLTSAPFSIGVIQELADDALDRASSWASAAWPLNRDIRLMSLNQGVADAMRHAHWSAAMTLALGEDTARRVADAHEKPADKLAGDDLLRTQMDLFNNQAGREIGKSEADRLTSAGVEVDKHLDAVTLDEVWDAVQTARLLGKLAALVKDEHTGDLAMGTTADPLAF